MIAQYASSKSKSNELETRSKTSESIRQEHSSQITLLQTPNEINEMIYLKELFFEYKASLFILQNALLKLELERESPR